MVSNRILILIITVVCHFAIPGTAEVLPPKDIDALKMMAVQDGGRTKPFDSFARETLQLTYGKSTFGDKPAVEIVTTWMLAPDIWEKKEFVKIDHRGLKEALKLPLEKVHFSPMELFANQRTDLIFRELASKRQNSEKLNPYFQSVQRLENQLLSFHGLRMGALRVAPPKEGDTWLALQQLEGPLKEQFQKFASAFARSLASPEVDYGYELNEFIATSRAANPALYPDRKQLQREVQYNSLHPFRWSWVLYLVAALLALIAWQTKWKWAHRTALAVTLIGIGFHIYGFVLRVWLTGRPPVSNMYESVVWVSFGVIVFAMIFEWMRKRGDILLAGSVVATICMIAADNAPVILDASLQPLEPVLRSNLWLTVHVLTITLSYAPLFLAAGIGVVGLFFIIKGESPNSERIRSLVQATYRSIQIGIVLLAAGTILGGVWADYSWGRFWGWDPKETWAFIALMGYIALLHGRLTGWVKNFGMLAGAVVAFNLVIMAWYGVNFVLGAGLHSYGFGAGGIEVVAGFCGFFLLYTVYAAHVHLLKSKNLAKSSEK